MPDFGNRIKYFTGDSAMKTSCGVIVVSMFLLVTGCAQKVNDPADVEAIRNLVNEFDEAFNAGDADAIANSYTESAFLMPPNQASLQGKEDILASYRQLLDQFDSEYNLATQDVQVSGDLAIARGSTQGTLTHKTSGAAYDMQEKWAAAYQREPDGSWKCLLDIWNSDLPVSESLPIGEDELALLQFEHDWMRAALNGDVAWMEQSFPDDFSLNSDGQVFSKRQYVTDFRRGAIKVDSMTQGEMKAMIIGNLATVHGVSTEKSNVRGQDTSGEYRWINIFARRNGRWQCVSAYATRVD